MLRWFARGPVLQILAMIAVTAGVLVVFSAGWALIVGGGLVFATGFELEREQIGREGKR